MQWWQKIFHTNWRNSLLGSRMIANYRAKGRRQHRKSRKFGTMSQLRLTPPPSPPTFGTFLNFRHFWKMLTSPPIWPNWDIFEFQTFLIKVILQNTLSNNWNWDILEKCWPPPLTKLGHFWISDIFYNGNIAKYCKNNWDGDIFENRDPPPLFSKFPNYLIVYFAILPL